MIFITNYLWLIQRSYMTRLSKAFGTVEHDILSQKLDYNGFPNASWFRRCLTNPTQCGLYNNCFSIQSSLLGSVLFPTDMKDIIFSPTILNLCSLLMIPAFFSSGDINENINTEGRILTKVQDLLCANKLSLTIAFHPIFQF